MGGQQAAREIGDALGAGVHVVEPIDLVVVNLYPFQQTVASGKQNVGTGQANQVMPAFGTNKNVWCYVDDIYSYLLARGTGAIPRGRPANKAAKSDAFIAQEDSCMNG